MQKSATRKQGSQDGVGKEYQVEKVDRAGGVRPVVVVIRFYNRRLTFRQTGRLLYYECEVIGKFDDYYAGGKVDYDGMMKRARRQARGIFTDRKLKS